MSALLSPSWPPPQYRAPPPTNYPPAKVRTTRASLRAALLWRNVSLAFREIIPPCTHLFLTLILPWWEREGRVIQEEEEEYEEEEFDFLLQREDGVTTTAMVETLMLLMPPNLSSKGRRAHLRVTSSLLHVPEERANPLTLGDLLSKVDDKHCFQRIDCLRDISKCLPIDHDTGS